jgi:hypothetical protein
LPKTLLFQMAAHRTVRSAEKTVLFAHVHLFVYYYIG